MTAINEVLLPAHVRLSLEATTKRDAILELIGSLKGDARVVDWEKFRDVVLQRDAGAVEEGGCGLCIAHGRGESVSRLVLAAGRLAQPPPCPEIGAPLRLVVVAGIPSAFNTEYLRVVGLVARVCRQPEQLNRLLHVKDTGKFISILHSAETHLGS